MKRIVVLLVSLFIFALAVSSCSTYRDCAAYGETTPYQKGNHR